MKAPLYIIVFGLFIWQQFAVAQSPITNIPTRDSATVYMDTIVKADSLSKAELYSAARLWFAEYFKSAKTVIDLDDKEAGIIIGKGNADMMIDTWIGGVENHCWFTVKISVKDNKYRLEVYDVFYRPSIGSYVGTTYLPPVTSYPADWFLPMRNSKQKWRIQYERETLRVLNDIFTTIQEQLSSRVKLSSEW